MLVNRCVRLFDQEIRYAMVDDESMYCLRPEELDPIVEQARAHGREPTLEPRDYHPYDEAACWGDGGRPSNTGASVDAGSSSDGGTGAG